MKDDNFFPKLERKNSKIIENSYLHFNNEIECNNFINKIKKLNYNISNICCGGKGVGINLNHFDKVNELYLEYTKNLENLNLEQINLSKIIIKSECCVCFTDTYELTKCNHFLCNSCTNQLLNNICPICRGNL